MGTMTKTHRTSQNTEYTKTQQTLRNNYFCVFRIFLLFFIFIFQLLKGLLQKMLNYRLGTVKEKHCGFSAAANLTLSQHFLEKKKKKNSHSLFLSRPLKS